MSDVTPLTAAPASNPSAPANSAPTAAQVVWYSALAGGMAWGIRGQYGHETGAMIAGLLVSLVIVVLLRPGAGVGAAARVVAATTIAMGFGGSETYGQTVGLTHDPAMVGNAAALVWGLWGLAIKGGIWIGFAGLFLGLGLSGVRYRPREILLLMLSFLALYVVGVWLLNEPYDPARRILPRFYFSADWRWRPDAELKPRREVWGGLGLALVGGIVWAARFKGDRVARNLACWGVLGGALGFPLGQCVQAGHAWNLEWFRTGWPTRLDSVMNWWNWMETTFGTVMGASLGWGAWRNRRHFAALTDPPAYDLRPPVEWTLVLLHVALLVLAEFTSVRWANALYDPGLILGLLPMVGVWGGRWWPVLLALPITALPIAGKTVEHLGGEAKAVSSPWSWIIYGVLPVAAALVMALRSGRMADVPGAGGLFARRTLLFTTWLYFGLNYAFFRFPWPWNPWTARTPNGLWFTVCALGLTWLACRVTSAGCATGTSATDGRCDRRPACYC